MGHSRRATGVMNAPSTRQNDDVRIIDANAPEVSFGIVGLFQRRELLWIFLKRAIAIRYRQMLLGIVWSVLWKIADSSFMKAMLRSRCVFSITLAASATLIEGARWMPAVTTEP